MGRVSEITFIGADAIIARQLDAAERAAEQCGEHLLAAQMVATPVESGTLRASEHIESIERSALQVTVTTATGGEASAYAARVHEGGPEYPIEAKDGGYLNWPGAEHPVKRVMHPATAPNPYMSDPLLANVGYYEQAAAAASAEMF